MPAYDYRCQKCEDTFEIERSMRDESKVVCTKCGSEDVSRIFTVNIATGAKASAKDRAKAAPSNPKMGGGHCCGGGCH